MKPTIALIITALLLGACTLSPNQQGGNSKMSQGTDGSGAAATTIPVPMSDQQEVKTAVDELSQELDTEFKDLDAVSDFADTTAQDFGQ